ncbi:MAG: hypothetical protein COC15_03725, partial [Legionellales bacterium]
MLKEMKVSQMSKISADALYVVTNFLDIKSIINLTLVNKYFYSAVDDARTWKRLAARILSNKYKINKSDAVKIIHTLALENIIEAKTERYCKGFGPDPLTINIVNKLTKAYTKKNIIYVKEFYRKLYRNCNPLAAALILKINTDSVNILLNIPQIKKYSSTRDSNIKLHCEISTNNDDEKSLEFPIKSLMALDIAILNGNFPVVKLFMEKGIKINSGDSYPLHYAVISRNVELATFILQKLGYTKYIDQKDRNGITPLEYTIYFNDKKMLSFLLKVAKSNSYKISEIPTAIAAQYGS